MEANSGAPLREMWYFAIPGGALRRGRTLAKRMFGEPLLLGRGDDGRVFALRDICPHRAMPLSRGSFDGSEIECCYHGWRFDATGRCTAIPSLAAEDKLDVARIRVKSFPAQELQGNIWVFFGEDPASAPPVPVLPAIGERAPGLFECMKLPSGVDHTVAGMMDPSHGAFIHRAWWWRSRGSIHEKARAFAASDYGFTMLRHVPSSNSRGYRVLGGVSETEIVFRLPGIRIEHVRIGRRNLVILTTATPVSATESELNQAIYWDFPWLTALKPVLSPFVRKFMRQDRDAMIMQTEGLRYDPTLLLVGDADQLARWYHRLKNEYARARSENRSFVNPVKDRVLRWRS